MLKKLIKSDLKDVYKILVIFYGLSLFFAILTRLFLSIENSFIMEVIGKICSGVTISMMFNILINNLMRLWVRFKHNFYGDESYLTHTLPVDKKTLYSWVDQLLNPSDAFIMLALFEGIKGKDFCEIVKLKMSDFNENEVTLCTGRKVIVSNKLLALAEESNSTDYYIFV